jgi:hypothetical protein
MQTPAVLLFLHMLGVTGFLWLASSYDVFHLNLTLQVRQGDLVVISILDAPSAPAETFCSVNLLAGLERCCSQDYIAGAAGVA